MTFRIPFTRIWCVWLRWPIHVYANRTLIECPYCHNPREQWLTKTMCGSCFYAEAVR